MKMSNKRVKGVGLLSGGLDSILAVKVLQEQNLDLLGIIFSTPFFGPRAGVDYGEILGIPLRIIDIGEKHLAMLKRPVYGYGSQMNPCIDCHALMLREAGRLMDAEGMDFLFTGEVLGQRPMSQRRDALRSVEKLSEYPGRILRPLSAKLLPPTSVELEGLVERSRLLDIHGRSRKRQMALAGAYGITEYPQPGGGCILTKQGFARRLKVLLENHPGAGVREAKIINSGRMFQLPGARLCLVGRDHADNERLEHEAGVQDYLLRVVEYPGPRALMLFAPGFDENLELAAQILAAYSDAPKGRDVTIEWKRGGEMGTFAGVPRERETFQQLMI
jgi:tRNA-uridine 2-sulfurtransferase